MHQHVQGSLLNPKRNRASRPAVAVLFLSESMPCIQIRPVQQLFQQLTHHGVATRRFLTGICQVFEPWPYHVLNKNSNQ